MPDMKTLRRLHGDLPETRVYMTDEQLVETRRRFNLRHTPGDYVTIRTLSGSERALLEGPAMIECGAVVCDCRGFEFPVSVDLISRDRRNVDAAAH